MELHGLRHAQLNGAIKYGKVVDPLVLHDVLVYVAEAVEGLIIRKRDE